MNIKKTKVIDTVKSTPTNGNEAMEAWRNNFKAQQICMSTFSKTIKVKKI